MPLVGIQSRADASDAYCFFHGLSLIKMAMLGTCKYSRVLPKHRCFLSLQKFMLCNERSPVKVDEANLYNHGFWKYPCYEEVDQMIDVCGPDLFEPLFEIYKVRLMSGTLKSWNYSKNNTQIDPYGTLSDRKTLYF